MVSGLICGIGSLPRDDDDYERHTRSADSSPRKSRPSKGSKNPYSDRGLDKFTALLAEIEEKRQQIYTQIDPNEISLVRFVYSGDHDFKPIVVKAKHKLEQEKNTSDLVVNPKNDRRKLNKLNSLSSIQVSKDVVKDDHLCEKMKRNNVIYAKLNKPMFYLIMVVILILAILVLFGRSFAIMCTSIGWYVIPIIINNVNNVSNSKASMKRKDYAMKRRFCDKTIMSSEGTTSFKHRKSF